MSVGKMTSSFTMGNKERPPPLAPLSPFEPDEKTENSNG